MTYNEHNLPANLLEPPIAPLHKHQKTNWRRNWSVYWIYTHWDGKQKGNLQILTDWVNRHDRKQKLTKQRIEAIAMRMHWALRDFQTLELDTIDTHASSVTP